MDAERRHAIEVRFLGRMTWLLLGGSMALGFTGLIQGWGRGVFLAAVLATSMALNVPAVRVAQRAAREGAAPHLVQALWLPVVLRAVGTLAVLVMLGR